MSKKKSEKKKASDLRDLWISFRLTVSTVRDDPVYDHFKCGKCSLNAEI